MRARPRAARIRACPDGRLAAAPGAGAQAHHQRRLAHPACDRRGARRRFPPPTQAPRPRLARDGNPDARRMSPDEYCEQKTARSGSSFYYSFRFLPPEQRRAVTALYAFCREVDDVVDEVTDPGVARLKLAWWRSELAAAFGGTPRHPVALALAPIVAAFKLPEEYFQAVIDG